MNEYASRLAMALGIKQDNDIREALNRYLGHAEWLTDDLKGRLVRQCFRDGSEIYVCDGKAILRLGPWEFPDLGPRMLTAGRKVEHLLTAAPVYEPPQTGQPAA